MALFVMDIDRISYIFGSFARRRQSHFGSAKRRSIDPLPKVFHDRSKSAPHQNSKKSTPTSPRAKSVIGDIFEETKFKCPVCRRQFQEPRVLSCLHTFCLRCLEELERRDAGGAWYDDEDVSGHKGEGTDSRKASSGGSGYDSIPGKSLRCPSCGSRSDIPAGGIAAFPPNYPLQNKMVLATLNSKATHLLCDLCPSDVSVICRDCITASHRNHHCEPISRAAKSHMCRLRLAADRAKAVIEESAVAASKLNSTSKKIEAQCNRVQGEVEKFVDEYVKAVEEHRNDLVQQIKQVKEEKLQSIAQEKIKLQKRIRDARDVAYFLDDLLNDGTEVEVLSFVHPVMSKIEQCNNLEEPKDMKLSGSLQFLREETVRCPNNIYTLYGVLTTQSVSPEHCVLNTDGLQNLRVGKKIEVLLETRDQDDMTIERGGEVVAADVRHRDAGVSRSLLVNVNDKRDGTYSVSFVPDVAGKLVLSINVKGQPIKGSPFPFTVRTIKPHVGTFHCCSFCSSGGSKEATCACGGKMPGGYKGCGHGHEGHPGRRHWSCCGNVLEHSECVRMNAHYQFTL